MYGGSVSLCANPAPKSPAHSRSRILSRSGFCLSVRVGTDRKGYLGDESDTKTGSVSPGSTQRFVSST